MLVATTIAVRTGSSCSSPDWSMACLVAASANWAKRSVTAATCGGIQSAASNPSAGENHAPASGGIHGVGRGTISHAASRS